MQKTIKQIQLNFGKLLLSITTGAAIALCIYFWFLQIPYAISLRRLGMTILLWIGISLVSYHLLSKFHTFLEREYKGIVLLTLDISFALSLFVSLVVISSERIPYNHLLLPIHNVEIVIDENQPAGQIIEIIYLNSGLQNISFDQLEKIGDWEKTKNGLVTRSGKPASLIYEGWLVDEPIIVFQAQQMGGSGKIFWDGNQINFDLQSENYAEIVFSREISVTPVNKLSVKAVTILAFTAICFPCVLVLLKHFRIPAKKFSLDEWFEDTTESLRKPVLLFICVSFFLSIALFVFPLEKQYSDEIYSSIQDSQLPNIILIIVDSLTAQDMSLFGYHLQTTPNLEQITQNWTVYTNAQTSETCSIGLFPALMTGRYPYFSYPYTRFGKLVSRDKNWVDISEFLSEAGYELWWNGYLSPGFYHLGRDFSETITNPINMPLISRYFQFQGMREHQFPFIPISMQFAHTFQKFRSDYFTTQDYSKAINDGRTQSPFFLYLHYEGAHGVPYEGGKYLGTFLPIEVGMIGRDGQETVVGEYSPDQQKEADMLRLRYDEGIRLQDENLSDFVKDLKDIGLYDSSLIIIMADHGQVFKKGFTTHCTPLLSYEETHTPILIKYPYQKEGEMVDQLVSSIDITPTILDIIGLQYDPDWFDGRSLLSSFTDNDDRIVFSRNSLEPGPNVVAINDSYRLVFSEGDYFLFNYIDDPTEKHNLLEGELSIEEQAVYQELKKVLNEYLKQIQMLESNY